MSKGPWAETFVFLDLEATGLPSMDPEIAELSLFAVHRSSLENPEHDESGTPLPPRVMDKLTLCMSPERPFTAKASEIAGLSREGLARCGKAGFDGTVVRTLQAFLSRHEGPVCLVAQNGFDYDFPLLCMELQRLGAHLPQDTVCLDTWHCGAWTVPTATALGPRAVRATAWAASSTTTSRRSRVQPTLLRAMCTPCLWSSCTALLSCSPGLTSRPSARPTWSPCTCHPMAQGSRPEPGAR